MNKEEILAYISANPTCYIATVEGNKPHLRVITIYRADEDGIAALPELDPEAPGHRVRPAASRRSICSTTVRTLRPSVSTVTSATSS